MLRRHGGAQPADLQQTTTRSAVRTLPELSVGREPEATIAVVGAPIVLFANSVGRQTVDGGQFAKLQQAPQTMSCDQGRFRG